MHRTLLTTAVALAAATTALPADPANANAVDDGVVIHHTFDALWSVDVAYSHKFSEPPVSSGEQADFRLTGSLPGLEFEDEVLLTSTSRPIDGSVKAPALTWLDHPEGTSDRCVGDEGQVKGFAVIGREGGGPSGSAALWFAPIAGAEIKTTCHDSDGKEHPGTFSIGTVSRAPGGPAGSWTRVHTTLAMVDQQQWELPVNIKVSGADCPDWDPAYSTSCTLTVTGRVKFFRTSRSEEIDLLSPNPPAPKPQPKPKPPRPKVDKPKLDRGARKLRGSVRCEYNCEVGIGIFSHRKNGKPYVKPVKRRSVSAKGGRTTKLTVGLSKAQLGTLKKSKRATVKITVTMNGETTTDTYTVKP